MLCAVTGHLFESLGFVPTWLLVTAFLLLCAAATASSIFYFFYFHVTLDKWRTKTNPQYPSVDEVRREITTTILYSPCAGFGTTLGLWLHHQGWGHGYCGLPQGFGWCSEAVMSIAILVGVDFLLWARHWFVHTTGLPIMHHVHHGYSNPTPFAVGANAMDEVLDFMHLAIIPLLVPVNMDLLCGVTFFMVGTYGSYLHCGHEFKWLSAHNPIFNTSFHHYVHHTVHSPTKVLHAGLVFRVWDQVAGSVYTKRCFCARCSCNSGGRTAADFARVRVPDYSALLHPKFWLTGMVE